MSRKNVIEIAKGLQCPVLYATRPTITEAFTLVTELACSSGAFGPAVLTAAHVLANSIAKQLLNEVEIAPTVNPRQEIIIQIMDCLEEQFDCYEEGLTSDLECVRKMYFDIDQAFCKLDTCTVCGCVNDGNHFETYGGNVCTSCNPDQRIFTVSYGVGFPVTQPVLKYRHQLLRFEGLDMGDETFIDNLNPGEMVDIHLEGNRRIHIMRTR